MTANYWNHFNEFDKQLIRLAEEKTELTQRLSVATYDSEELRRTNVFNDVFFIWYEGHFATINNFRMGRLPARQVDWAEINATWGFAALLLHTIAQQLNFTFQTGTLIPNGSFSRIEKVEGKSSTIYELYGSSDISLGKLFWYRRFDNAMLAFLDCVREVSDYVTQKRDPNFQLPHKIEGEKIGGIAFSFSNEELWTKGLKYLLTNLKWLLLSLDKI